MTPATTATKPKTIERTWVHSSAFTPIPTPCKIVLVLSRRSFILQDSEYNRTDNPSFWSLTQAQTDSLETLLNDPAFNRTSLLDWIDEMNPTLNV